MLNASQVINNDLRLVNKVSQNQNVQQNAETRSMIDSDRSTIQGISRAFSSLDNVNPQNRSALTSSYSSAANSVAAHATLTNDISNMREDSSRQHPKVANGTVREEELVYQVINSLNSLVNVYNSQVTDRASSDNSAASSASSASDRPARRVPHFQSKDHYRHDSQQEFHKAALAALRNLSGYVGKYNGDEL